MEAAADIKWNGYSLAERDWRWQRVRDGAAKAGFDCIFVPLCVDGRNLHLSLEQARGTRSDCRFLTLLDNAAVILPTDGRKPIVLSDQEDDNAWLPEFRPVEDSWGTSMAQALIDAGMERARIGVSGIRRGFYTHGRAFHGEDAHGHDGHERPQGQPFGAQGGFHRAALVGLDVEQDEVGPFGPGVHAQVAQQVLLHEQERAEEEGAETEGEYDH